jgi:hypothetical protein
VLLGITVAYRTEYKLKTSKAECNIRTLRFLRSR